MSLDLSSGFPSGLSHRLMPFNVLIGLGAGSYQVYICDVQDLTANVFLRTCTDTNVYAEKVEAMGGFSIRPMF